MARRDNRRGMALHNAEVKGREWARAGKPREQHPYAGKKIRGPVHGLYWAWMRGYDDFIKEKELWNPSG